MLLTSMWFLSHVVVLFRRHVACIICKNRLRQETAWVIHTIKNKSHLYYTDDVDGLVQDGNNYIAKAISNPNDQTQMLPKRVFSY